MSKSEQLKAQRKAEREVRAELMTFMMQDRCDDAIFEMKCGKTLSEACVYARISESSFRRYAGPARDLGLGRGVIKKVGAA